MRWYFEHEKPQETVDRLAWVPPRHSRQPRPFGFSSGTPVICHYANLPIPDPGEDQPPP